MNRIEWQEDDPDEEGEIALSLTIISGDRALIARAKRALREILDERPNIAQVPRAPDGRH